MTRRGRPRVSLPAAELRALREQDPARWSWTALARRAGAARSTVRRAVTSIARGVAPVPKISEEAS